MEITADIYKANLLIEKTYTCPIISLAVSGRYSLLSILIISYIIQVTVAIFTFMMDTLSAGV